MVQVLDQKVVTSQYMNIKEFLYSMSGIIICYIVGGRKYLRYFRSRC